jgi:hypothetical protein
MSGGGYTQVSKSINADLYPDLAAAGGLGNALNTALHAIGSSLRTQEDGHLQPIVYARVDDGERSCQVMVASSQRAFSVDFWSQGVQYAHGWNPNLKDVASAIALFVTRRSDMNGLMAAFPSLTPKAGYIHERGAAAYVDNAWSKLLGWLTNEQSGSSMRRLLPVAIEASRNHQLRGLLPYTSLGRLCFSRTTGYPFDSVSHVIVPVYETEGSYAVTDESSGPIATGLTARQAVDMTAKHVGDSPARHGTAEKPKP